MLRDTSPPFIYFRFGFYNCSVLFKLGAAPYHMWIADVYEGSPTIVSLIFAVVPKNI